MKQQYFTKHSLQLSQPIEPLHAGRHSTYLQSLRSKIIYLHWQFPKHK